MVATRAQLSKVDAGLSSLSKQSNEYAKLCQELDMAEKEVEVGAWHGMAWRCWRYSLATHRCIITKANLPSPHPTV